MKICLKSKAQYIIWNTVLWWQSKIWMYDENSRVIKVSNVRWLQMWLKNFYQWSKMKEVWKRHYHEISTPSITTYPWINLQLELHKRKNGKVIKATLSKKVWIWKRAFHLSVMKIWASSRKLNQGSNKWWGTEPVIGVQCKNKMTMIDEHIPKHQVSVNQVKGCVELKNENEIPREKTC